MERFMKRRLWIISCLLLVVVGFGRCSRKDSQSPAEMPKVTAFLLQKSNPATMLDVTGQPQPSKTLEMSFPIAGKLLFVFQPSAIVGGQAYSDAIETHVARGAIIAQLDTAPFQVAVHAAQSKYKAAQDELANLQKQYPGESPDTQPKLAEALQNVTVCEAAEKAAQNHLQQCNLRAPFHGRISKLFRTEGTNVQAGQPIVRIEQLDPIGVRIVISDETYRQLATGAEAKVYPLDNPKPTIGHIELPPVNDTDPLRAYTASVLVANPFVPVELPDEPHELALPQIAKISPVLPETIAGHQEFFVNVRCLQDVAKGAFVWLVDGVSNTTLAGHTDPVLTLRKVHVTLSEDRRNLLGSNIYRRLDVPGSLAEGSLLAIGVPDDFQDGGKVFYLRQRRLFQSGQTVQVKLALGRASEGYYVPASAVKTDDNGKSFVLVATRPAIGLPKADPVQVPIQEPLGNQPVTVTAIEVKILHPIGTLLQIQGDRLVADAKIILPGQQNIEPNQTVIVTHVQQSDH